MTSTLKINISEGTHNLRESNFHERCVYIRKYFLSNHKDSFEQILGAEYFVSEKINEKMENNCHEVLSLPPLCKIVKIWHLITAIIFKSMRERFLNLVVKQHLNFVKVQKCALYWIQKDINWCLSDSNVKDNWMKCLPINVTMSTKINDA